jgi:hypothetical protein
MSEAMTKIVIPYRASLLAALVRLLPSFAGGLYLSSFFDDDVPRWAILFRFEQ